MVEHALTSNEAAIVAAAQTADVTAELLRFAREGAASPTFAFSDEVVGMLAEAIKLAIEIDAETVLPGPNTHLDQNELELFVNLRAAAAAFIDGWCG